MGSNNNDLASSIVTNSLLTSMKTGIPLIDALVSLVFITEFKNSTVKNISIFFVIIAGIITQRITKNMDILGSIYIKLCEYYDMQSLLKYIPSEYMRQFLIHCGNGNTLSIKITTANSYFEMRNQYNLSALLTKVENYYPNVKRMQLAYEELFQHPGEYNDAFLSYKDYENADMYYQNVLKLRRFPPETNTWYVLDDDIQFSWNITKNKQDICVSSGTIVTTTVKDSFYYTINLRSCVKDTVALVDYMNQTRINFVAASDKIKKNISEKKSKIIKSTKAFKGTIYEIRDAPYKEKLDNESANNELEKEIYVKHKVGSFSRPLISIFFEEKEKLERMLSDFSEKKGICEKFQDRRKFSLMLYGEPGCGKTSLAAAVATELKRDIIMVSIKDKNMCDDKLSYILKNYNEGYVIVLDELDTREAFAERNKENNSQNSTNSTGNSMNSSGSDFSDSDDFAGVYDQDFDSGKLFDVKRSVINQMGRLHIQNQKKLTLGAFLEAMDGINSNEGRVVIAMTNHPKLLDKAILRPGRFNLMLNLKGLNRADTKKYFEYVFAGIMEIQNEEIEDACDYVVECNISTSILEQGCVEKYSMRDNKSLKECLIDIKNSFDAISQ